MYDTSDLDAFDAFDDVASPDDGDWSSWVDPNETDWASLGYEHTPGGIFDDHLDAAPETEWLDHASLDEASWQAWDPTRDVDDMVPGPWPTAAGPFEDGFA